MKLSVSIQAHPDRNYEVAALRLGLRKFGSLAPVAWDKEGLPNGNADRGWRTARAAWMLHDPAADFHLVLQDDAVPCADLEDGLEQALEHVPTDTVVSAYLGKGGMALPSWGALAAEADRRQASWVVSAKLMWGVAIILPVRLIPEMIDYADRRNGTATTDDMRVAGWIQSRHGDVWYCWPSLVDHRPGQSLTKHHAKNRVAWRHHQGSALELNWSGPVVKDPALAMMRLPRSAPRGDWKVTSPERRPAPGR